MQIAYTYLLIVLRNNILIYTDVDTIWLKDPRSFLNGDYDMWASMDGPVHYCTGFMAFKPSLLSVDLLENSFIVPP
jgi:mannosyltransferase OCH1-like enzyme